MRLGKSSNEFLQASNSKIHVIVVAIIVIAAIAVVVIVAVVVVDAVVDGCILLKQISSNRKSTNCIGKINITIIVVVAVAVVVYDFYKHDYGVGE